MEVNIYPAPQAAINYVCFNMRWDDRKEIWSSHRRTPEEAALVCGQVSPYAVSVGGIPCILFGCNGSSSVGIPWLLATDDIRQIGVRFIRGSRPIVDDWLTRYEVLENFVHAGNEISIRWLKWLGFDLQETITVNNEPFIRFVARRNKDV